MMFLIFPAIVSTQRVFSIAQSIPASGIDKSRIDPNSTTFFQRLSQINLKKPLQTHIFLLFFKNLENYPMSIHSVTYFESQNKQCLMAHFCFDQFKNGEKFHCRVCYSLFLLFVFHTKSGITNNHRNGSNDISY